MSALWSPLKSATQVTDGFPHLSSTVHVVLMNPVPSDAFRYTFPPAAEAMSALGLPAKFPFHVRSALPQWKTSVLTKAVDESATPRMTHRLNLRFITHAL